MEAVIQSEIFRNAVVGGTLTAVLCAMVGFFMVLKALAFASEALTDIGFAGATGSVLLGWNPFVGMMGFGLLAVVSFGALGHRWKGRDLEIGMVLSFALGLGVLFLTLYARSSATHANSGIGILFGSLLSLSTPVIGLLAGVSAVAVLILAVVFRPLLYSAVDPGTARAKGVPTRALDFLFLLLLAVTTAASIQSMGVLLAFALLSAPAAAALKFVRHPGWSFLTAILLALGIVWISLGMAFFGPWPRVPVGFYVASLSAGIYGASLVRHRLRRRVEVEVHHHHHEREIHAHD